MITSRAIGMGFIVLCIVLGGFIGARIDQTTMALLGGAALGLLIAIPATVLCVVVALRGNTQSVWPTAPAMQPTPTHAPVSPPAPVINVNVVFVPRGAHRGDKIEALMQTGMAYEQARLAIIDGTARFVELPEPR